MAVPNAPRIIVRRPRPQHRQAHRGGAWKVAYADFVTAMMAFFLLLWLIAATSLEKKEGIASYFAPQSVSLSRSGAGGMLGGVSILGSDAEAAAGSPPVAALSLTTLPGPDDGNRPRQTTTPSEDLVDDGSAYGVFAARPLPEPPAFGPQRPSFSPEDAAIRQAAEREDAEFARAEAELRAAILATPDLRDLAANLLVDRIPDGLRIQLIDRQDYAMFAVGSAGMLPRTARLLAQVARVVGPLPNPISITGHTDALPFANDSAYGNWELSSDRANASRRTLVEAGVPAARIARVVGRADTDPIDAADPKAPRNRRISITLLRLANEAGPDPTGPREPRD